MGRLAGTLLGVIALLAIAAVTVAAATGGAARPQSVPAPAPGGGGGEVVDLNELAETKQAETHANEKPRESVTDAQMEAVEREIQRRAKKVLGASPDDGIAPGAPSDREVRQALREMREGRDAGPIKRGSGDFIYPIDGMFTSPFGMRWGRLHAGIDLAAPTGRPIRAAASGRVILAAVTGGYGLYTCIAHNSSISTCYAHQSRFGARQGDSVRQGEVIGYVGNTGHSFGAHLHFEVRINGRPVDPMGYL
ncbi:MAG: M23 family metallopeptidase [Actinomycetota bacterium]|nr:M23 family metallopeptidase [Actinomycetota bacterium]